MIQKLMSFLTHYSTNLFCSLLSQGIFFLLFFLTFSSVKNHRSVFCVNRTLFTFLSRLWKTVDFTKRSQVLLRPWLAFMPRNVVDLQWVSPTLTSRLNWFRPIRKHRGNADKVHGRTNRFSKFYNNFMSVVEIISEIPFCRSCKIRSWTSIYVYIL